MIDQVSQALLEADRMMTQAESALAAGDGLGALCALESLKQMVTDRQNLEHRGEPLQYFLQAIAAEIKMERKAQALELGEETPPPLYLSFFNVIDKFVQLGLKKGEWSSRSRHLMPHALVQAAAQAHSKGDEVLARNFWERAFTLSPLSSDVLEAKRRFGFTTPGGSPVLSAGSVRGHFFEQGLSSLVPWEGGVLSATRKKNAQGYYLDVVIEWVGSDSESRKVALPSPVDMRLLPGGVNPFFSFARHPEDCRVVFPEFVSDDEVSLSVLNISDGGKTPFAQSPVKAVEYPFQVSSGPDAVWHVSIFSGRIVEFDLDGRVKAKLEGKNALPGAHTVLSLGDGKRLVVCSPDRVRRKYGRFLTCDTLSPIFLWNWDTDTGSLEPVRWPSSILKSPRHVFRVREHFIFCIDSVMEIYDKDFNLLYSIDLYAHVSTALNIERQFSLDVSFLCCLDKDTMWFADQVATCSIGCISLNFNE